MYTSVYIDIHIYVQKIYICVFSAGFQFEFIYQIENEKEKITIRQCTSIYHIRYVIYLFIQNKFLLFMPTYKNIESK